MNKADLDRILGDVDNYYKQAQREHTLDEIDKISYKIMRLTEIQGLVDILIPNNPPNHFLGFRNLSNFIIKMILSSQPNMREPDASIAYKIENELFPPLTLIGYHATLGVMQMALGNYKNGLGYIVSMQETACQFPDDNILAGAAKWGFSIFAFAAQLKIVYKELFESAFACQRALTTKGDPGLETHSRETVSLCVDLFDIIINIAIASGKVEGFDVTEPALVMLSYKLSRLAKEVDKGFNNKLKVQNWVKEMFTQMGHKYYT